MGHWGTDHERPGGTRSWCPHGQRTFNDSHRAELDGENEGRYGQLVNQVYRLADTSWGVFSMQTLTRTPEFRQATL